MTRLRLPGGTLRRRVASVALALAAWGCGDDDDSGTSYTCGPGTQVSGDQCVPISTSNPDGGGEGGVPDAGPQLQSDAAVTVACGAGTVLANGQCVVDTTMSLTCGPGTVAQGKTCVLAPAAALSVQGLTVSHVALRSQGAVMGDGAQLNQYYPVEVSVGLTYSGDKADIPVVFALGEVPNLVQGQPDPAQTDLDFCLVGGFDVHHPGGSTPTEAIATGTMYVPKDCLKANETMRSVSPVVLVDPDSVVAATETVSRSVAFIKANAQEPELTACRQDATPTGAKGTCQVELKVGASPGIDFELAELSVESAVAVLDRCADDWASIANGSAGVDVARPVSYRCNSTIVPEFKRDAMGALVKDEAGNPVQATYTNAQAQTLPKWVYGAADVSVDVTVLAHGANDSLVESIDAANAAGADPKKLVKNVLAEHGLQIVYQIRPAQSEGASWKPLYLHEEGEQAKAGEEGESGQTQTQFEETEAAPSTPHYYSHGLYVENDCGERNLDSCNDQLNPRTDIIYGDWAEQTDFVVRACLVAVDGDGDEDAAFDVNDKNDCKEIPIKVVRHDTSGAAANAASYGFNYQFKDGVGSQSTLRLGWDMHTWNNVNNTGVTVDNEASMVLGSNLVGSTDILRGWAKGAAYVSIVGSYYDYGLSAFGTKLWGDAKVVPEYHWEKDWSVSKELRRSMILWAGAVPVNVEIRFSGQAGLVANLDIVAVNKPFASDEESEAYLLSKAGTANRIGLATLSVTPYGNMVVVAKASISAAAVRVGVAGQLTLLDLRVPLSGRVWWGATNLSPVTLKMGAWADLKLNFSTMDGTVYVFAENWAIEWCSKKIVFKRIKYPCGEGWDTFWDYEIADWDGWTWNQTMWSSPYKEYSIP